MRIFLIGFMGSGKTYTGRRMAKMLGRDFIDLDEYIEAKEGRTISAIFAQEGEDYFRKIEKKCLHEMKKKSNAIIATGGGTPCFFDNMDWMNRNGRTVYLETPAETLLQRLKNEKEKRPLLKNFSTKELRLFIKNKLKEREAFYHKAEITIEN
ncbi:MAG TPA: shikimate kinase [Phaeodactylibacter sp.]|nr:shikimate kinase [Phaeodactylibacter sp.]